VKQVDFTIVTPSFRQLEQLECCIASIADQEGVSVEHIVQDGGTEGFAEFSKKMAKRWPDRPGYRRDMVSEPDQGMYDAINRGLKRATGSICAYLNCDEQYLPGVLQMVLRRFQISPETDLFLGDVVVVDGEGKPICLRKMVAPTLAHTWTCHFAGLTAGIFFRRSIIEKGLLFDTSYRVAADAEWYVRLLRAGLRTKTLGEITSVFAEDGGNLGMGAAAREERTRLNQTAPLWMRILRPWWVIWHRSRRWLGGCHGTQDISLRIHNPGQVVRHEVAAHGLRTTWPGRLKNF
jgi:glycosyltransferase involved in cell wall biosynthesis